MYQELQIFAFLYTQSVSIYVFLDIVIKTSELLPIDYINSVITFAAFSPT